MGKIYGNKSQCRYVRNWKLFLNFLCVSEIYVKLGVFWKKDQSHHLSITEIITCQTDSYLNLQKSIFHATLHRKHVNGSQAMLRSLRNMIHTTPPLIWVRRSIKRLVLVWFELLGQFVNTLTPDDKYSRQNLENLSQQDPMQTSLKLKNCPRFFIPFLKSTLNFE